MPLTLDEFVAAVNADEEKLKRGEAPAGVFSCSACSIPLQETLTGARPCGDGRHLCSDCYFEEFGRELDAHPIGALRVARGA